MSFYSAVGGWIIEYIIRSLTNTMAANAETRFTDFIAQGYKPIAYQFAFLALTFGIVAMGVKKGIELCNKILMPLLLALLIILCVRAVTLPGAVEGLKFLFYPDFSKLTGNSILAAMGHAFFSLSLGMGAMITYGSYIKRDEDLVTSSGIIAASDVLISILGGVLVFSAAAAFQVETGAGAGLVFITLPEMFQQMTGGMFFSTLFFALLGIAALTSAISLVEVVVSFCVEELRISRIAAATLVSFCIFLLGILCSLSLGMTPELGLFGKNFFDLMDFASSNRFLPLGVFFIAIYVGWSLKKHITVRELTNDGSQKFTGLRVFYFLIRFIAPVAILIVFLAGLLRG
jgi:NSS family neurotransmitter:Na+ symporter